MLRTMSRERNRSRGLDHDPRSLDSRLPDGPDVDPARAPIPNQGIATEGVVDTALDDPEAHKNLFGIFSGATRKGRWEPPGRLSVFAIFGGVELDFCDAELLEGETVVEAWAFCGGIEIRVPEDIDVITEGVGIFGHFAQRDQRGSDPQPPRLRIKGVSLFGGVEVKGPKKRRRRRRRSRSSG